jgi:hypothetical protein
MGDVQMEVLAMEVLAMEVQRRMRALSQLAL